MNVNLIHLPVKEEPHAITLMEVLTAHVQTHVQVTVMLVVAVHVLEEERAVAVVKMISLVSVHLGILENVVKNF